MGSKKFRLKRQQVQIDVQQLDRLVDKACQEPLNHEEGDLLKSSIRAMAERLMPQVRTTERARDLSDNPPAEDGPEGAKSSTEKKKRPGHGRNAAAAYTGAKVVRVSHPDLVPKATCTGCNKGRLYEQPARLLVRIVGMHPIQATRYDLQDLRCNLCGEVYPTPAPEGVGEEKYDHSVTSMVGLLKYGLGLPFYRIARLQFQAGVPLPAGTQSDLVTAGAQKLQPVYEELERQAAQGAVLFNDDTGVRILDEVPRPADQDEDRTGLHTTGTVSQHDGHQIALFTSGPQHAGENMRDLLEQRDETQPAPVLMSDGLSHNTCKLPPALETVLSNCLVHARRNFVNTLDAFPDECRHVIDELGLIYRADDHAREKGLGDAARLAFHKEESGPVMDRLHEWMEGHINNKTVEPNSNLGKAIRYFLKRWDRLTLFLRHPGAPLDNNAAERALKKAVLHRKNSLFYKTLNGARVGDLYMSLIYTCELNKVDSFLYLTTLLRREEEARVNPGAWMPWNFHEHLPPAPS